MYRANKILRVPNIINYQTLCPIHKTKYTIHLDSHLGTQKAVYFLLIIDTSFPHSARMYYCSTDTDARAQVCLWPQSHTEAQLMQSNKIRYATFNNELWCTSLIMKGKCRDIEIM